MAGWEYLVSKMKPFKKHVWVPVWHIDTLDAWETLHELKMCCSEIDWVFFCKRFVICVAGSDSCVKGFALWTKGKLKFISPTSILIWDVIPAVGLRWLPTQSLKLTRYMLSSQQTCAVCLEEFRTRDELGVCPCSHAFHKKWVQIIWW